ncbi:MAG: hypothetical protein K6C36_02895 [Clostridia bacterium]|nr:hypothetical protein [Clostridia bacterium]
MNRGPGFREAKTGPLPHRVLRRGACLLTALAVLLPALVIAFPRADAFVYAYGVDVSYAQGANVNWATVRAQNITFAVIRIGYTVNGGATMDAQFERNYVGAKNAGLNVGVYFYTYSTTVAGAMSDAAAVISWLGGRKLEYPVYYDMEEDRQTTLTTRTRTDMCLAFCSALENAGYLAGVYSSKDWYKTKYFKDEIAARYEIWQAEWHRTRLPDEDLSSECAMWQYSDKGYVAGFNSRVDLDVCYKDYPTLVRQRGLSGYEKQDIVDTLFPTVELPDVSIVSDLAGRVIDQYSQMLGDYKISWGIFSSYLYNVPPGTNLLNFTANIRSATPPVVTDQDGNKLTDENALVTTGCTAEYRSPLFSLPVSYPIVVNGDLDSDGLATAADARSALRGALKLEKLDSLQNAAADRDGDKSITADDARTVLRIALGLD